MTEDATGSTVPRRQLGRHLRNLRGASNITVRGAAKALEWSDAKIWRIESGLTSLRSLDVEAMCKVYGAAPDITEALMALAKETKAKGWWHAYGEVIPEWFDVYIGLEEAASQLSWYESELIPGLLQTEDYARAVITDGRPDLDDQEIDRRVQFRIARQTLIHRPTDSPALHVVLNESVLRRPVGSPQIMASQLEHLTQAGELDTVSLRIVPFGAGFHLGLLTGPFEILRFPPARVNGGNSEPPTVYADLFTGALYLDKPHEVEQYTTAFESIWTTALDESGSKQLINQAAEELRQ